MFSLNLSVHSHPIFMKFCKDYGDLGLLYLSIYITEFVILCLYVEILCAFLFNYVTSTDYVV